MVLSSLPDTILELSGENATLLIQLLCPVKVLISWPVNAFHILMVLSSLPDTILELSGENTTLET